jgi:hypothetical protein
VAPKRRPSAARDGLRARSRPMAPPANVASQNLLTFVKALPPRSPGVLDLAWTFRGHRPDKASTPYAQDRPEAPAFSTSLGICAPFHVWILPNHYNATTLSSELSSAAGHVGDHRRTGRSRASAVAGKASDCAGHVLLSVSTCGQYMRPYAVCGRGCLSERPRTAVPDGSDSDVVYPAACQARPDE